MCSDQVPCRMVVHRCGLDQRSLVSGSSGHDLYMGGVPMVRGRSHNTRKLIYSTVLAIDEPCFSLVISLPAVQQVKGEQKSPGLPHLSIDLTAFKRLKAQQEQPHSVIWQVMYNDWAIIVTSIMHCCSRQPQLPEVFIFPYKGAGDRNRYTLINGQPLLILRLMRPYSGVSPLVQFTQLKHTLVD